MKSITAAILASGFIVYVLVTLLAADRSSDTTSSFPRGDDQTISDVGLLFRWHR
jgi:hypothetical protein